MSTGERLASEADAGERATLSLASLLAICDGLLNEVGRRRHLFAWLRDPLAGFEQWLPVDAYYPGNRVVAVSAETAAGHEELYAELVPAHGLKLLTFDVAELGGDPGAARAALERAIASLALPERHVEGGRDGGRDSNPRENPVAKALQSLVPPPAPQPAVRREPPPNLAAAAQRGARFVEAHSSELSRTQAQRPRPRLRPPAASRPSPARVRRRIPQLDTLGLLTGPVLFAVLCAEVYLAVAVAWLNGGMALLGFGVLLDACCRLLGTIAAERVGGRGWAWACLLGGSPLVVWFAFFRRSGPVMRPPAPLAGLLGLPALALIALGLVL